MDAGSSHSVWPEQAEGPSPFKGVRVSHELCPPAREWQGYPLSQSLPPLAMTFRAFGMSCPPLRQPPRPLLGSRGLSWVLLPARALPGTLSRAPFASACLREGSLGPLTSPWSVNQDHEGHVPRPLPQGPEVLIHQCWLLSSFPCSWEADSIVSGEKSIQQHSEHVCYANLHRTPWVKTEEKVSPLCKSLKSHSVISYPQIFKQSLET